MKHFLFLFYFLGLAILTQFAHANIDTRKYEDFESLSETAIEDFQKSLKKELLAAIKSGGHINAIDICSSKAQELALEFSEKYGVSIKRTALRWRNPVNAPEPIEAMAIEEFIRRIQAGEDIKSISFISAYDNGLIYLKPIQMQTMCSACHGKDIPVEVRQKILSIYPEDAANNFEEGQIRGAFSVFTEGKKE